MKRHTPEEMAEKMKRAKFYLSHPVWSIDRIADELSVERSLFNRKFKEHSGVAPYEYRRSHLGGRVSYRVIKAERYLKHTDLSRDEIAYRVGYADSVALGKAFKKQVGESVSNYRARFRNKPIPRVVLEAQKLLIETDKTLGEIGRELGYVDHKSITKTFERHVGESCVDFRRRHWGSDYFPPMVEKVKTLLVETDLPQHVIANRVGWQTNRSMSAMFQETEGMTPRQYRIQERIRRQAMREAAVPSPENA